MLIKIIISEIGENCTSISIVGQPNPNPCAPGLICRNSICSCQCAQN